MLNDEHGQRRVLRDVGADGPEQSLAPALPATASHDENGVFGALELGELRERIARIVCRFNDD